MSESQERFDQFAILELMGHRRLAGKVSEMTIAGAPFIRIEIPETKDSKEFTQIYSPGAIYCITPTTEEICRQMAGNSWSAPISPYELLPAPEREGSFD